MRGEGASRLGGSGRRPRRGVGSVQAAGDHLRGRRSGEGASESEASEKEVEVLEDGDSATYILGEPCDGASVDDEAGLECVAGAGVSYFGVSGASESVQQSDEI